MGKHISLDKVVRSAWRRRLPRGAIESIVRGALYRELDRLQENSERKLWKQLKCR